MFDHDDCDGDDSNDEAMYVGDPHDELDDSAAPLPYESSAENLADYLDRLDVLLWAVSDPHAPPCEPAVVSNMRTLHPELGDDQPGLDAGRRKKLRRKLADDMLERIRAREAVSEVTLRVRLVELAFALSQPELDALLLAATPRLDPRFEPMWRQVDPYSAEPLIHTIVEVLARGPRARLEVERIFWPGGRLNRRQLVMLERARLGAPSEIAFETPQVPLWLIGQLSGAHAGCSALSAFGEVLEPNLRLEELVLPEVVRSAALRAVRGHELLRERARDWGLARACVPRSATVMLVVGARGSGKSSLAEALARETERALVRLDAARLSALRDDVELLGLAFSEAAYHDALVFIDEAEGVFPRAQYLVSLRLDPFEDFSGVVVLATSRPELVRQAVLSRVDLRLDLPLPTPKERLTLWRRALPAALPLAADVNLEALATRYALYGGGIETAVLGAARSALGRGAVSVAMGDFEEAAQCALDASLMAAGGAPELHAV